MISRVDEENLSMSLLKKVLLQYKQLTDQESSNKFEILLFNLFLVNHLVSKGSDIDNVTEFCVKILGLDKEFVNLMFEFSKRNISHKINKAPINTPINTEFIFNWVKENQKQLKDENELLIKLSYFCKFYESGDLEVLHEYTKKHNKADTESLQEIIFSFLNPLDRRNKEDFKWSPRKAKRSLKKEFRDYIYKNKNLLFDSPFENLIKIGISVIKCPVCCEDEERNNKCPTCDSSIKEVG